MLPLRSASNYARIALADTLLALIGVSVAYVNTQLRDESAVLRFVDVMLFIDSLSFISDGIGSV